MDYGNYPNALFKTRPDYVDAEWDFAKIERMFLAEGDDAWEKAVDAVNVAALAHATLAPLHDLTKGRVTRWLREKARVVGTDGPETHAKPSRIATGRRLIRGEDMSRIVTAAETTLHVDVPDAELLRSRLKEVDAHIASQVGPVVPSHRGQVSHAASWAQPKNARGMLAMRTRDDNGPIRMAQDFDPRELAARRALLRAAQTAWKSDGARPAVEVNDDWLCDVFVQPGSKVRATGSAYPNGGDVAVVVDGDWYETVHEAGHTLVDDRFVAQVTDRDDTGRPTRVLALRAEAHGSSPEGAEYQYELAPARIGWDGNTPTLLWDVAFPTPLPPSPDPWDTDGTQGRRPIIA